MATEVERLAVLIEANTKSYENAMRRMQQQTERAIRGSSESVNRLDKALRSAGESASEFVTGLARGALASAGIAGLAEMAKAAVESAAAISDLSEKTGISTDKIQELAFGAQQANMGFEEFSSGLLKFSRGLGEAQQGGGELLQMFNGLNINLRNSDGSFKSLYQSLLDFADATKGASTQQEALANIVTAMGRGGDDWLDFLSKGADGVRAFGDQARQTGSVVDEELIKRGKQFDTEWTVALEVVSAQTKSMALSFLDAARAVTLFLTSAGGLRQLPQTVNEITKANSLLSGGPTVMRGGKENLDTAAIASTARRIASEAARAQREHEAAVRRVAGAYKELGDDMEKILNEERRLSDQVAFFGEQGLDAFEKLAAGGAKFSDVMREVATAIIHAALQASLLGQGPLAQLFGTNATAAGAGGLLGRLFGTVPSSTGVVARQGGGPVSAGRPYVVGEHGPELMVPGSSGYVVPHGGGGGSTQVHIHTEPGMRAETRQTMGPQGQNIQVMIRSAVRSELPGAIGPVLKSSYGITPSLRRRKGS